MLEVMNAPMFYQWFGKFSNQKSDASFKTVELSSVCLSSCLRKSLSGK